MRRHSGNAFIALILSTTAVVADPVTVVALGDSLTAGYGLPEGEGFVPQLQKWLDAKGAEAVVVNAGVSGDTSAGGLARLDWSLTPDTDALIVALGGNDLLRGLDPAITRDNLDAILTGAAGRDLPALLIGLPGPTNYGIEWKEQFDAIFPELAKKHGALIDARLLADVYLELKGGRERRLELTPAAMAQAVGAARQAAYGARPRPLALRSTDAERDRHAAFIRDVVKSDDLWKKHGL